MRIPKNIKIWDVATQKKKMVWKIADKISHIKWLDHASWIAIGFKDGQLAIESAEKEKTIYKGKVSEGKILGIDYLPSEKLLLLRDNIGNIAVYKVI